MRRILAVALSALTMIGLTGTAAQAGPADGSTPQPESSTVTYQIPAKNLNLHASFTTKDAAKRQDPPLGGCNYNDVSGTIVASYTDGKLVGTNSTWHAKVLCTTTAPGQSMAGITVDSTLFYNGRNVARGTPFVCQNCNLGNSTGAYLMAGGSGSYWIGGTFVFFLPSGWVWSGIPDGCLTLTASALECGSTSGTVYVSPTH